MDNWPGTPTGSAVSRIRLSAVSRVTRPSVWSGMQPWLGWEPLLTADKALEHSP